MCVIVDKVCRLLYRLVAHGTIPRLSIQGDKRSLRPKNGRIILALEYVEILGQDETLGST